MSEQLCVVTSSWTRQAFAALVVMELWSGHHLPNLSSVFSSYRQNNRGTSLFLYLANANFLISTTSGRRHPRHGLSSFSCSTVSSLSRRQQSTQHQLDKSMQEMPDHHARSVNDLARQW